MNINIGIKILMIAVAAPKQINIYAAENATALTMNNMSENAQAGVIA